MLLVPRLFGQLLTVQQVLVRLSPVPCFRMSRHSTLGGLPVKRHGASCLFDRATPNSTDTVSAGLQKGRIPWYSEPLVPGMLPPVQPSFVQLASEQLPLMQSSSVRLSAPQLSSAQPPPPQA